MEEGKVCASNGCGCSQTSNVKIEKKEMTYKDETGTILFGQAMLDRHTEELKKNNELLKVKIQLDNKRFFLDTIKWVVLFVLIVALFWYVKHYNIYSNSLRIIAGC